MKNFAKIALVNFMLLAPATLNQQLVQADETESLQSSSQSDAEAISKQQNQLNQNSDKNKSTDNKTAANDNNNKKPTADTKSSNANKQSSHNKQTNSALDNKQTANSAAKNTLSNDTSNSSNTANTASVNKIHQNNADKANKPRAKAKTSSKKIQKYQQTDDADPDFYLAKPGYTNSIRSQKQQNTKPAVISRKVIYHRASANSDNHQALPQASASILPVLPRTGFKKSVWQHDNHPITLKSAALGLSACIIFLVAISIPSKRY